MTTLAIIAIGLIALVAVIAWVQARAQSGTYRPLASRKPTSDFDTDVPLGMEATNLNLVQSVSRQNEMLERSNTSVTEKGQRTTWGNGLLVKPWADDETYAKRFHFAFKRKDKG